MAVHPSPRRKIVQAVWPLLMAAVLGAVLLGDPALLRLVMTALARVNPGAVLIVLPVQLLAIVVCVFAQQALLPGVPFKASFASRLVRDAANHLVFLPPGFGDAIGARMLVLAGGRLRAALSVRALDIMAEILGQLPFMALAGVVLWQLGSKTDWPELHLLGGPWFWGIIAGLALIAVVVTAQFAPLAAWLRHLRIEALLLRRELRRRWRGMPLAIVLHMLGWGLSGAQLWLAGWVFGFKLSLFGALALEGAASSSRILLFFIPGGIGTQEAAIVAAGLAFGLSPTQSLALALVFRLRDLAFGLGLLWWPIAEYSQRK